MRLEHNIQFALMAGGGFRLLSDGSHGRINSLDLFGAEVGLPSQLVERGKPRVAPNVLFRKVQAPSPKTLDKNW
jgi:hypothetical protein